ncbi:L-aspartate oxidase [Litoribrevibacter albus]|uniref:L-aspartate oxidase n=1 Tax=Litoribrevibacter albus TaxID=1473156 RepID=A0AA37W6S8_9GAMM|nr:L-aspartate oxidase [Litoribrevibacter albus]GLQ29801.1 L-aspartate oxidase [Litoribrevibacter albus]
MSNTNTPSHQFDVVIIGSGAAGLTTALQLPEHFKIAIICKQSMTSGSTPWAQGGVAAVLDEQDSVESHCQDTMIAGSNLNNPNMVKFIVEDSTESIQWLIDQGVPFTKDTVLDGAPPETETHNDSRTFHLTKEGGHSFRRIIHAADATGAAITKTLIERTLERKNIEVFENRIAVDLIISRDNQGQSNCVGLYVLNLESEHVETFQAEHTVLATGGASKAYLYTSNPDGASGDGIAMAWRAGCRVANMEFNQFHPTCLYHPHAKSFLVSEALRGEGAHLTLPNGKRFMHQFDERGELAPRDIVARAIDHEMKRLGCDHVYLDISHKPEDFIKSHFPTIYERCLKFNIDITKEPIPVVPAAHYTCGGVVIDHKGRTDVRSLYAIGEVAHSGLHGANRLASNSLLECIVLGRSAAKDILKRHVDAVAPYNVNIPAWDESQVTNSDEDVIISHNWDELRRFMWDYVGIVRTTKRLERAKHRVDLLLREIHEYYSNYKVSRDLIELRNLVIVADLIIRSALLRKESRGLHFTLDYPDLLPKAVDTILTPPPRQPSWR